MKSRPILFSGPMICALIAGKKTQTRRMLNPPPVHGVSRGQPIVLWGTPTQKTTNKDVWLARCPYGVPGDLLIVREAWRFAGWCPAEYSGLGGKGMAVDIEYAADKAKRTVLHPAFDIDTIHTSPRPSIHMFRWASRLTLEITDVRVERLQEISAADAVAEGITPAPGSWWSGAEGQVATSPEAAYALLWNSINGPESWNANPWCWAVSFRCIRQNVDEVISDREDHPPIASGGRANG